MIRRLKDFLFNVILKTYWKIGFVETQNDFLSDKDKKRIIWVKFPYKEKWYADPFILDVSGDTLTLLVEEFDYNLNKGVITLLDINKNDGIIIFEKKLLDLETHLSFPAIYRENNRIFVYPENSRSGSVYIYEFIKPSRELTNKRILINKPLSDAIIYNANKESIIIGTSGKNKNGSVVEVYKLRSDIINGYKLEQTITLSDNSARNGGDILVLKDNTIVKVSQESNSMYGHALVFQKMKDQGNGFEMEELLRLEPFERYMIGIHTYNRFKNFTVIDAKYYMHSFWGKIVGKTISMIRKNNPQK